MGRIKFFRLTLDQYNSLEEIDADAVYFITDSKTLIMGGNQYSHKERGDKYPVKQSYEHAIYDTVAQLDNNNAMEFSGYFAQGISRIELWPVSDSGSGNICISVGEQTFTIPVNETPSHVALDLAEPLKGRISITRNCDNANDTLNNDSTPITVYVVDWKLFQGEK